MQIKTLLLFTALIFLFGGCSTKCNGKLCAPPPSKYEKKQMIVKSPEIRISPIVGTRSEESRIVRDFGVIQKAWIAPYIDQDSNLVAAHDVYVVIREPRWIPGEELPKASSGIKPPMGGIPFHFQNSQLDKSVDLTKDLTIREFVNEVYSKDSNSSLTPKQKDDLEKFDKSIRKFIEKDTK